MTDAPTHADGRRVLQPEERIAEVLFGLIMVLTFTGSLSVAEAGRDDVRAMLVGALGCNVAWGLIDAVLYLMGSLADRGRSLRALQAVRRAADGRTARRWIAGALPPLVASLMREEELDALRERLQRLPEPPPRAWLARRDWIGAVGVFVLVFLSTFPVAVPFLFIHEVGPAMRASNAVAVLMLLLAGVAYGRCVGRSPWLTGIAMVALGVALVALTVALGG